MEEVSSTFFSIRFCGQKTDFEKFVKSTFKTVLSAKSNSFSILNTGCHASVKDLINNIKHVKLVSIGKNLLNVFQQGPGSPRRQKSPQVLNNPDYRTSFSLTNRSFLFLQRSFYNKITING